MKRKKYSILLFILPMIFSMVTSLSKADALSNGSSNFTLTEENPGIGYWTPGTLSTGVTTGSYPFAMMINRSTREYIYCIEPGIYSQNGDNYNARDVASMFNYLQSTYISGRTTAAQKQLWVTRILQTLNNTTRYSTGSAAQQLDNNIRYAATNSLIWEVVAEERDGSFNYIGARPGYVSVDSVIHFNDSSYTNRYYQIRNEIEDIMKKYSTRPVFSTNSASGAQTIVLDTYNSSTGTFSKTFTDTNGVAKYYKFTSSNSNISVTTNSANQITISSKVANATGTISGYNNSIRGNADNSTSLVTGHGAGNAQYVLSAVNLTDPTRNAYYNIKTSVAATTGSLTINPNGGSWNGGTSTQKFTQTVGTTKNIALPNRTGYTFSGWSTSGKGLFDGKIASQGFSTPGITYGAHISNIGWTSWTTNGGASNSNLSNGIEAFQLALSNGLSNNFDVQYNAYVEGAGWQGWKSDGTVAGTAGQSKRIQAIQIKLTGVLANYYNVQYRTYVQNVGWQSWVTNGTTSGIAGKNLADIQVQITPKASSFNGTANKYYFLDGNGTLTANWTSNNYTVIFNGNNATQGSMANQSFRYDVAQNLRANSFSRIGYTFTGWNTKADGTGTNYSNQQSVKNLTTANGGTVTLYAQWKINNYTLTVDPNGGIWASKANSQTFTQNYLSTKTIQDPTRAHYRFLNWNLSGAGTLSNKTFTYGAGNATLTAQWQKLTPPVLSSKDHYVFVGDMLSEASIKESIGITDAIYTDADIRPTLKLYDYSAIDFNQKGVYEVTATATNSGINYSEDSSDYMGIVKFRVYVIDTADAEHILSPVRYISVDYYNTLSLDSKWREFPNLNKKLIDSLNKQINPATENGAKGLYEEEDVIFQLSLTNSDVEALQEVYKNNYTLSTEEALQILADNQNIVFDKIKEQWVFDGVNWKYQKANGQFAVNETLILDGFAYIFDEDGHIQSEPQISDVEQKTLVFKIINQDTFCVDSNGIIQVGLQNVDGKLYYFNNGQVPGKMLGAMVKENQMIDGKMYYFDSETGIVVNIV